MPSTNSNFNDIGGLQTDIRDVLKARGSKTQRGSLFITTKIEAGFGIKPSNCLTATAASALAEVEENLVELGMDLVVSLFSLFLVSFSW